MSQATQSGDGAVYGGFMIEHPPTHTPAPTPLLPAKPVLFPERPVSQPAARLPAVKVTLPAAMYYTGVHSQAEYNIALEGRLEAGAGRGGSWGRKGGGGVQFLLPLAPGVKRTSWHERNND